MTRTSRNLIIAALALAAAGAVYVVLTLKSGATLDEASPLATGAGTDALADMDADTKARFMAEVERMRGDIMEMDERMPGSPRLLAEGAFMPRFHGVEGRALLIEDGDRRVVRFEDFATDNGPNLHIYLATDTAASDYVDLGAIRATKGNVNYEIGPEVDTEKYDKVLVWCVPFGVLFSYADLGG